MLKLLCVSGVCVYSCVCISVYVWVSFVISLSTSLFSAPPPPSLSQADKYFVNYEMIHIESFEQNPGRFWFEV